MRKLSTTLLACLALAAALATAGCGEAKIRSDSRVGVGLTTNDAYLSVLKVQNENAVAYSNAILKTVPSQEVEAFAKNAIEVRNSEAKEIAALQKEDDPNTDLKADAETLTYTLSQLAITADGMPLAAPSTDAGYIKAMQHNGKGVIRGSNTEIARGGPGVVTLAKNVVVQRTAELKSLENLQ